MSYILDALRKAEAERERGTVPGIHAQPMFAGAQQAAATGRAPPWPALLMGAVVVLVALLLWMWLGSGPARDAVSSAPVPSPVAPAAQPAPPPVATAPAATPPAAIATTPTAAPAVATAVPVARAPDPAAPPRKSRATAPAPTDVGAAAKTASAASAAGRVYALSELPDEIRQQLPPMTISGSMYSSVPASRILFVNGQVLHEGEAIAPGATLLQIRVKTALVAFRGYQFTIGF